MQILRNSLCTGLVTAILMSASFVNASQTNYVANLNLKKVEQGWGKPGIDETIDGKPLTIAGQKFERGFGTHAESLLVLKLDGKGDRKSTRLNSSH